MSQAITEWTPAHDAWGTFVSRHQELGYSPGTWQFYNFLRQHRQALQDADVIRKAKGRFWIARTSQFTQVAFDCATGAPVTSAHSAEAAA